MSEENMNPSPGQKGKKGVRGILINEEWINEQLKRMEADQPKNQQEAIKAGILEVEEFLKEIVASLKKYKGT